MTDSIISVTAEDGYLLQVKLSLPVSVPDKIVIYVNGSGPNTYNVKRQAPDGTFFNYHDLFAEEFTSRGIAYCRHSTRGVTDSDVAPDFVYINENEYKTYLPHNSVSDIISIIDYLKSSGFQKSKIYLLGWSEGTIIAPLIALQNSTKVDGLFLAGYTNENLRDTLLWQLSGNSILINNRRVFDYERKGYISKENFLEDRYNVREAVFGSSTFEELDINQDGKLTAEDFVPLSVSHLQGMLKAIEHSDDEWIKNNHGIQLTSGWFREHFSLAANKEILPQLNLPIHIFAGEYDSMTPQFYAKNIEKTFQQFGKGNLAVHYFENHDHNLNFLKWVLKKELSEGIQSIVDIIENHS